MSCFIIDHLRTSGVATAILEEQPIDKILLPCVCQSLESRGLVQMWQSSFLQLLPTPAKVGAHCVRFRISFTRAQTNTYELVLQEGLEELAPQIKAAVAEVFTTMRGRELSVAELGRILKRLHQLKLRPFTNPFAAELAKRAREMGWREMLHALECGAPGVWDEKHKIQREALDDELRWVRAQQQE